MSVSSVNPTIPAPVLLEPRIMMDANLEWDLASTTALSGSLSSMVQAFAEQYAAVDELEVPGFDALLSGDNAAGPVSGNGAQAADMSAVLNAADRVQSAFADLRAAVLEGSRDLIGTGEIDYSTDEFLPGGQVRPVADDALRDIALADIERIADDAIIADLVQSGWVAETVEEDQPQTAKKPVSEPGPVLTPELADHETGISERDANSAKRPVSEPQTGADPAVPADVFDALETPVIGMASDAWSHAIGLDAAGLLVLPSGTSPAGDDVIDWRPDVLSNDAIHLVAADIAPRAPVIDTPPERPALDLASIQAARIADHLFVPELDEAGVGAFMAPAVLGLVRSGPLPAAPETVHPKQLTPAQAKALSGSGTLEAEPFEFLFASGAAAVDTASNITVTELEGFNALALLNDPGPLLSGIYDIFQELDGLFDSFLADIDLPIIGDAIGTGLTFFDDVMNSVLLPALEYAETPQEDGSLPSTIDIINGFVNDALNSVFGTEDVEYLHAFLDTSGTTAESFIYGAINFSGKLFSEMLDIDFDFGIPGLNIEVEEGSEILLELSYTVNIGFGLDAGGFFLLNDTDDAEVSIDFLVDAGTFSGSMSVLNLLGLSAQAVTLDEDGVIISDASTDGGTAQLHAFLEADLYGDSGSEIERDFSNIEPLDGSGNVLAYENIIYLDELDFGELVSFDFGAEVDVQIGVVGNILDPFSGEALEIGGNPILPNVAAELVLDASYTLAEGLSVDALGIHNVRIDASQLYDALIRPLVDPILAVVGPLLDVIDIIFQDPIGLLKDLAVDLVALWFPIIKTVDNVAEIANSIAQFVADLADAGGMVHFGSFDFTEFGDELASGETNASDIDLTTLDPTGFTTDDGDGGFGTFGDPGDGFSVDIPLLKNPFSAISLLLGDFSGVELVRARYTWFNIDSADLDFTQLFLDSLDIPDIVVDALESLEVGTLISNRIEGHGITMFEVGYDLSGVQNFLNSYDPFRLFDGVFIEAGEGSLVDIELDIIMFANAFIATIGGGGELDLKFNITDPNDDGKVRLSELLDAILFMVKNGAVTPHQQIAYMLEGTMSFLVDTEASFLGATETIYELELPPIELELFDPEPSLVSGLDSDRSSILSLEGLLNLLGLGGGGEDEVGTQVLNLGARIMGANSDMVEDGDDIVVLGTLANRYAVTLNNAEGSLDGEIDPDAKAVIIPAGEGDNVVDMSKFSDADSDRVTITYSGAGQDTITLPVGGLNVVFSGAGDDVITAPDDAQGTYIIFSEGGADTIDIPGGNVIVFSGDDYGMRDVFLTEFANGDVTPERVRELLGLLEDDTADPGADGHYDVGGDTPVNLDVLLENYTEISQLKADRDDESITVGAGNHILLTGKGDDVIRGDLDGAGEVTVLSGAGDDDIAIGGTTVFIEGGAGSDTIEVNGQTVEVWGWGKAAGERGGLGTTSEIDALASNDGDDIIIGGSGDDQLFGQVGDDLIEGNGGNDTIGGGLGNDVIAGGTFAFTLDGAALDIRDVDIASAIDGVLDIRVNDLADGDDTIRGGSGDDILLGGGGADTISGAAGLDLIAGDFASILVSGNMIAQRMSALFEESSRQGGDTIDAGSADDIAMGGGGDDALISASGDNILLGDFGILEGADLREGAETIVSINSMQGGNDTLTTGRGNDLLIGGEADDVLNSGLGVDILFGDNANVDFPGLTLTGLALDTDGNDTLVMGENLSGTEPAPVDQNDLAFGGLGDDTITATVGGLTLIGDSGEMLLRAEALEALANYADPGNAPSDAVLAEAEAAWFLFDAMVASAQTAPDARDGNDDVTIAGGINSIALGGGDDTALLQDGLNHLLGDDGIMATLLNDEKDTIRYQLTSTDMAAASGRDTITAGDGNNVLIGGEQGDVIEAGDGFNLILGDRGDYLSSNSERVGFLRSDASLLGGDDVITTGAGNAIIVAGQGDDTVSVGDGDDVALGDDAKVTHQDGWDILIVDTVNHASGGHDTLTAEGTRGDNVLMGQTGDDVIDGGLDDDLVVGDNADLDFLPDARSFDGQSGLDKLFRFVSVVPDVDGDDVLRGHDGTDYLVGGFGDEEMFGGDGQDFLIGDTAIMSRAYTAQGDGVFGELWIDTNFAYETGGYDEMHGEAGFDVMIGNLGPDIFFGDTEEDALFSDGFAGYFTTQWDSGLFNQPTPHWQLVKVNFAGPGAVDIVSKAQSAGSIGLSLDRAPEGEASRGADEAPGVRSSAVFDRVDTTAVSASHLDMLMDYVLGDLMMSAIAELIAMGLEGEALRAAIAAELGVHMSQALQIDGVSQSLLLERVMTIIEDRLDLDQSAAIPPQHTGAPMMVAAE
ncbi:calcium-binding protein [Maricaulis sp.]|uniref:calcium-binding protein n=1 Tax=Maricaulis sp. TaxID=1486257 RepID=UPI002628CAE1|nr:calcium-binding protein [Maricaulis sp.]